MPVTFDSKYLGDMRKGVVREARMRFFELVTAVDPVAVNRSL